MPEHERQCRDPVDISFCLEGHETGASWPQASSYQVMKPSEMFLFDAAEGSRRARRRGVERPRELLRPRLWQREGPASVSPAGAAVRPGLSRRVCAAAVRAAALRVLPRRLKRDGPQRSWPITYTAVGISPLQLLLYDGCRDAAGSLLSLAPVLSRYDGCDGGRSSRRGRRRLPGNLLSSLPQ